MNWEHSVLNKIYRTSKFKIAIGNPCTMIEKTNYIDRIKYFIEKYQLDNHFNNFLKLDIHVNHLAAIYHKKENGNTFYFDYNTNYYFVLYSNFFEIEKYYYVDDYSTTGKHCADFAYKWKSYLLQLLFLKSFNEKEFILNLKNNFNKHFMFNNFLFSNQVSHYDIVLLSILQNSSLWKNRNEIFSDDKELMHIKRWFDYLEKYFDIDYKKIERYKDSRLKEMLGETYKLTSCEDLVSAVIDNQTEKLITLLNHGENVNSREMKTYKTLLHLACQKGDLTLVKLLISYECDLEALDFEYMTPLFDAIYCRNIPLCDFLIEEMKVNVAHREIQDRTPFYWAACSKCLQMVDYLLSKKGIDFNVPSKMGRTALSKACWKGRADIVARLCREKSIMVNFPDKNGRYPIHNAVWGDNMLGKKDSGMNHKDSPESALYLIQAGAEIEVEDYEGYTPLMIAASTNGVKSLDLLLAKGANPNHLSKFHSNALMEAAKYGNVEAIKCLLKYCTENNALIMDVKDIYNHNVCEKAILPDNVECLKQLLEYKEKQMSLTNDELIGYLVLAIQSNSAGCYVILLNIAVKRELFVNAETNDYLTEIIDRVCNLQRYELFNLLFTRYHDQVSCVFRRNIQFLIKGYALLKKVTEYEDKENEEVKKDFMANMSIIINDYYETIITDKKLSETMLKAISYFGDQDHLSLLISKFSNEEDISVELDNDYLVQDKKKYEYFKAKKRNKPEVFNIYQGEWDEIFQEMEKNSILSIGIKSGKSDFVNFILRFPRIQKMIFERIPSNSSNIMHILLEKGENLNTFLQIIEIIESKFCEKISDFILMLDEFDSNSLTPLDILMKNQLYDMVETYTQILNDLICRHRLHTHAQFIQYTILDFFSFTDHEITVPEDFKLYTDTQIKENFSLLKKLQSNSNQMINCIPGYSCINGILHTLFSKLSELIEKVSIGTISEDFSLKNTKYGHMWVDSEEMLIECVRHLTSQAIIGIDLEFHGNNSEKDGIVCILQVSSLEMSFAIDTLLLRNEVTVHMKRIFEDFNILKIFHGCDNDLVWLATNFEIFVKNIYDTGRAFLIFSRHILNLNKTFQLENLPSLNYLSKFFFQREMDKSYQKSDWRIRPLTMSKKENDSILFQKIN